jgi:hypothetical protein
MKKLKILMGENLVWNSPVKVGSHHYAKRFIRNGNIVFWVSLPWHPLHLLNGLRYERILHWNKGKPKKETSGLITFCPLTLLPYRNNFIIRNNFAARNTLNFSWPSFTKILKLTNFQHADILWLTDPRFICLEKYVKYRYLIYRCVDAIETFSNVPSGVIELEKELVQGADIVFATAKTLVEKLRKWRKKVVLLQNGVDLENFIREEYTEPKEIKNIPHPRVIYVGTIGPWFDVKLIASAADKLKNIHFILIGPLKVNCSLLRHYPNVHLLGSKNYADIPNFLKYSDIAMIPFVKTNLTNAVNPIKLYEYFSVGLPVISTDIQEVINLHSPAIIADSENNFIRGVIQILESPYDRTRSIRFAVNNSWAARYNLIKEELEELGLGE